MFSVNWASILASSLSVYYLSFFQVFTSLYLVILRFLVTEINTETTQNSKKRQLRNKIKEGDSENSDLKITRYTDTNTQNKLR